jgi:hypothetical protein
LQIAVHADGGLHDAVDLFFAFGPLAGDCFFALRPNLLSWMKKLRRLAARFGDGSGSL